MDNNTTQTNSGDPWVRSVQQWVNGTYEGRTSFENPIDVNGRTGWTTVYALTRALQLELGITSPVNNFGPSTQSAYRAFGELEEGDGAEFFEDEKTHNILRILKGAMICKGYDPGGFNGYFNEVTKSSIQNLQRDAGLPIQDGKVYVHVMQALLTMDAYRLTPGGDTTVQEIQRALNNRYYEYSGVNPCDGHYQRQTNRALIHGLQTEIGIPKASQTGAMGPATRAGLPNLHPGTTSPFVRLFKYALVFNRYSVPNLNANWNYSDTSLLDIINSFQRFTMLPITGYLNKDTWLSLLVSTGNPDRPGTACDTSTRVTPARAKTLVDNGYTHVGRYLTNVEGSTFDKKLYHDEVRDILNAGMSIFPIYQLDGRNANDFDYNTGVEHYKAAYQAALDFGFPGGTTIYFAVDFDAYGHEINTQIMNYFRGLNAAMHSFFGTIYHIGIYGPRSACIAISERHLAKYSFVSGMSTGFSGNLGYPLPQNWAFDQIKEFTIGSGAGAIAIDNNINSGRDPGTAEFNRPEKVFGFESNWGHLETSFNEGWTLSDKEILMETGANKDFSRSYPYSTRYIDGFLSGRIFFGNPKREWFELGNITSIDGLYNQARNWTEQIVSAAPGSVTIEMVDRTITNLLAPDGDQKVLEVSSRIAGLDENGWNYVEIEVRHEVAELVHVFEKLTVNRIRFNDWWDDNIQLTPLEITEGLFILFVILYSIPVGAAAGLLLLVRRTIGRLISQLV
ncbi:glycoside hydrolase domain-containing protein [Shouchella sp. 1P09AA]|uniref:glycoside hydrolase domain-containing protein n=1 Tax=unclassified Shouchella TaxID=2893065 RepID=UPI00399F738C